MIEIKRKTPEEIDAELRRILEAETSIDKRDGDGFGYEIFVDYDEKLSEASLAKITRSEDPAMELEDILEEWRFGSEDYYYSELKKTIEANFEEAESYESEINTWIQENVYWYLPDKVIEQEVNVVVSLDTGDMNTDFTECNIVNWYGTCGGYNPDHELSKTSPIRWLAAQQGRLNEIQDLINLSFDDEVETIDRSGYSKFATSVMDELYNACSHMNTLIFLCKMSLKDFIKLRELVASEKELNNSYYFDERKGEKTFTVSKEAMCGLYDIWGGGGSVLEIELEKDVVIPTKAVFDIWIDCRGSRANGRGYDVDDVYGLCGDAWSGEIKEVAA